MISQILPLLSFLLYFRSIELVRKNCNKLIDISNFQLHNEGWPQHGQALWGIIISLTSLLCTLKACSNLVTSFPVWWRKNSEGKLDKSKNKSKVNGRNMCLCSVWCLSIALGAPSCLGVHFLKERTMN